MAEGPVKLVVTTQYLWLDTVSHYNTVPASPWSWQGSRRETVTSGSLHGLVSQPTPERQAPLASVKLASGLQAATNVKRCSCCTFPLYLAGRIRSRPSCRLAPD
jgi:hypothetical protein